MSDVPKITCTICDPRAGDVQGIRRPVTVTSGELTELIKHIVQEHISKTHIEGLVRTLVLEESALLTDDAARNAAQAAQETADEALKLAQKAAESAEAAAEAADELNENA